MKKLLHVLLVVLCFGSLAKADAPLVYCKGTACGDDGLRAYAYEIDSASYPMIEFVVGTNDLNARNYTNVLVPLGWKFTVEDEGMSHDHGRFTPHGQVSTGPCKCLTTGRVRWWTDDPGHAVEFFTFGYDHCYLPEDVGWTLTTRREGPPPRQYEFRQDWDAPVGTGAGPVHGPSRAPSDREVIKKAKCKVKHGQVKKAIVVLKNATPSGNYHCTLDTGQREFSQAKPNGKIKFVFSGDNAPPCGPNVATVLDQHRHFVCGC